MIDYQYKIENSRVYEVAKRTPLELMPHLSLRIKNQIWLKREDTQVVFSFKLRGAYNKMAYLSTEALAKGVICASAGNHAQGVALSAQSLGCRAVIVMPTTTPEIKVKAVRRLGAEVILFGDSYSEAYTHALALEHSESLTFVHPYDDPDVIAGQGTIGMEIIQQAMLEGDLKQNGTDALVPIDAIFCCVGGGGLLAGVAAYVKAMRSEIKVIGVEAEGADAMTLSLQQGQRVVLEQVGLFADGAAVKQVGEHTFALCQQYVDEMIVVDNDAICAAIKDVFEETRSILEPAGALAVAGAKAYIEKYQLQNKKIVAIASGANMNFDRLRFVAERAELGEQREALLAVTIPERPGAFKHFCRLLGQRNITEFNYRYADAHQAHVFVGLSIQKADESLQLVKTLAAEGLPTLDLTHNELAKLHLRHLVGGRAPQVNDELVYRFEFPEKPGALMTFLEAMGQDWNISLFHYRNHGTDFGRVLVGMQVPISQISVFQSFLNRLGYSYWDESNNPAYHLFLS